jgi:hypothetical protein
MLMMLLVYKHLSILFLPIQSILPASLHATDEALLALVIENNLPQAIYAKIMDWAHFAQYSKYTFSSAPVFCTALHQMYAKYANISGGPPISKIVTVPGYQPMCVYHFNFLQQAEHLFSDSEFSSFLRVEYRPFLELGVEYVSQ